MIEYTQAEDFYMRKGRTAFDALVEQGCVYRVGNVEYPQAISAAHALKIYANTFGWEGEKVNLLRPIPGGGWYIRTWEQPNTEALAKMIGLLPKEEITYTMPTYVRLGAADLDVYMHEKFNEFIKNQDTEESQ